MDREDSVRQLPAGKMENLKKLFEQENEASNSKPTPPARPPVPTNRVRSPARPPARSPQVNNKQHLREPEGSGQQKQTTADGSPSHDRRRLSPTVSRRITGLMGGHTSSDNDKSQSHSNVSNNAFGSGSPKRAERRSRPGSDNPPPPPPPQSVSKANPLYGDNSMVESEVKDSYAKVIKKNKKDKDKIGDENGGQSSSTSAGSGDLQRREALRLKNQGDKKKMVAGVDDGNESSGSTGVSVASRTKLFNQPKNERPCPPKKPEAIKRQSSLRAQVDSGEKQDAGGEEIYCDPWENNSAVEKLRQQQTPSRPVSSVIPQRKTALDHKHSVPLLPPTKPNVSSLGSPSKATPKTPETSQKSRPDPPPKPPRTHAHDEYMKGKMPEDAKPRQPSQVPNKENEEPVISSTGTISVRDRISKMQNKTQDSPSRTSTGSVKEDAPNVTMRHQRPTRPPPPRKRPNSGGHPPALKPRPLTQMVPHSHEGPCIIPVSPTRRPIISRQTSSHGINGARNPKDQLPPEPGDGRPLGRYPLRRSFSSECIHGSQASCLDAQDEDMDHWSNVAQSPSYESEYEAVIDPDGYAVPNEFLKLPGSKPALDYTFYGAGESPHKFLTRLDGFGATSPSPGPPAFIQDGSPGFGANTAMRDQSLEKVNKKKMLMVKQKINQVYADVDIIIRGTSQVMEEDEPEEAREAVVDQTELKRRIEYCTSIRQRTDKSIKKSKEYLSAIYPQLFEYCLVVGIRPLTDASGYEPYILHKFPENRSYKLGSQGEIYMPKMEVSSNLSVPNFCFPDASIFKPGSVTSVSESYSFVMTSAEGTRVYGYCRRIQPSDASLPEVICIISPIDAFNMYNTLLNEIEVRRRQSLDLASEVIAASFGRPLPKPGRICHIRTLDDSGEMETIFLSRPCDNRLNDVNYESPLISLGTDKLVKVFSSMLMERRIILCSSNLSSLTQTVHALCALLYPFQWQHVYIPLLPMEMLEVVCSPTPFIVGVLSAFLPQVLTMDMEEVLIVDLDKKNIVRNLGDEATLLPKKIQRALKTAINMCKIDSEARTAQWLMVAESFLRMFIEVIGHFGNHVLTQQDGNRIFQKEGFIIEVISKEVRQFLEWFTMTQMFEVFIVNHVEKSDWGSCDLFMQRLQDFKETREESGRHKGLGAKVKNFRKAIKTKLTAS